MQPRATSIGAHRYTLPIEVVVLGDRRATLLVVLIGIVGDDAVARLAQPLAVGIVDVAFGGQAGATNTAQVVLMIPTHGLPAGAGPARSHIAVVVIVVPLAVVAVAHGMTMEGGCQNVLIVATL